MFSFVIVWMVYGQASEIVWKKGDEYRFPHATLHAKSTTKCSTRISKVSSQITNVTQKTSLYTHHTDYKKKGGKKKG